MVYTFDSLSVKAYLAKLYVNVGVLENVKNDRNKCRDNLTGNCGDGGTGHLETGESAESENKNRVKNNVDDSADELSAHCEKRAAGRLKQTFKAELKENTK